MVEDRPHDRAHAEAGRAAARSRVRELLGAGGAGDVQVEPRHVLAHEAAEERRGVDVVGLARDRALQRVRDVALERTVEVAVERERPEPLACRGGARREEASVITTSGRLCVI